MQLTFGDAEDLSQRKKSRREIIQDGMEQVVPWNRLLAMTKPKYPVSAILGVATAVRLALHLTAAKCH